MKITLICALLLSASVAYAGDNSSPNHKHPAGSPEWRNVLQTKINLLEQERITLLTSTRNGELYEDAERRYKRAEGIQNRINRFSAMLSDNSESSNNRGRRPVRTSNPVAETAVDFSYLSSRNKPAVRARPVTDADPTAPVDSSERREKILQKVEQLKREHNELLTPQPGETNRQASIRLKRAQHELRRINKITSAMDN